MSHHDSHDTNHFSCRTASPDRGSKLDHTSHGTTPTHCRSCRTGQAHWLAWFRQDVSFHLNFHYTRRPFQCRSRRCIHILLTCSRRVPRTPTAPPSEDRIGSPVAISPHGDCSVFCRTSSHHSRKHSPLAVGHSLHTATVCLNHFYSQKTVCHS